MLGEHPTGNAAHQKVSGNAAIYSVHAGSISVSTFIDSLCLLPLLSIETP